MSDTKITVVTKTLPEFLDSMRFSGEYPQQFDNIHKQFEGIRMQKYPQLRSVLALCEEPNLYEYLNAIGVDVAMFALTTYNYVRERGNLALADIRLECEIAPEKIFNSVIPIVIRSLKVFYE